MVIYILVVLHTGLFTSLYIGCVPCWSVCWSIYVLCCDPRGSMCWSLIYWLLSMLNSQVQWLPAEPGDPLGVSNQSLPNLLPCDRVPYADLHTHTGWVQTSGHFIILSFDYFLRHININMVIQIYRKDRCRRSPLN